MDLVIDNVTIFTNDKANQILTGQGVAITGRSIAAVGPAAVTLAEAEGLDAPPSCIRATPTTSRWTAAGACSCPAW